MLQRTGTGKPFGNSENYPLVVMNVMNCGQELERNDLHMLQVTKLEL